MEFKNARQLKDWISNLEQSKKIATGTLLQNYMMERLLERVSLSPYRENIILKGGFLIAAMVGLDKRSTMDIDTTIKGMIVSQEKIEKILLEIISVDAGDGVTFVVQGIKNIHDVSEYDDFRVSLLASIYTIRVNMKIDITTGDAIIPREIEFHYPLMFEDKTIPIMAYNVYTILAEKIETILSRNVTNTRGRDFYDVYLLLSQRSNKLSKDELLRAIRIKFESRGSLDILEKHTEYLRHIAESPEIAKIWERYSNRYSYANGIALNDILALLGWIFE